MKKEEKAEKLKVKKEINKGNMDGARLDAAIARLDTLAKMTTIS